VHAALRVRETDLISNLRIEKTIAEDRKRERERERERGERERNERMRNTSVYKAKQILAGSTSPTKCSDRGKATLSSIPVCLPGFTPLPSKPVHPQSYIHYFALPPRRFYTVDT